ncbi:MAG: hypothetical protein J6C55_01500 [Oscillospiraceae bacterium]|nr:hypothetical protein [Oscillospiraceae bacterium]
MEAKKKIVKKAVSETVGFIYKDKKLVKSGNILCYGNPNDKYVVLLEILDKKDKVESLNIEISDKISIALFDRQALIKNPNAMFLDFCERHGLYDALETAHMWLVKDETTVKIK